MSLPAGVSSIYSLLRSSNFNCSFLKNVCDLKKLSLVSSTIKNFHISSPQNDLMEFFDDKKNWGQPEVKVGRSWKIEELRIKSNADLHKLWYVLLKEKNMLLTMEHEYKEKYQPFPNPERIDKVEESMENLEKVVRERNKAFHELETGETGERPIGHEVNCFGLPYTFRMKQHLIPKNINKKFLENQKLYNKTTDYTYVKEFLGKLEEKKKRLAFMRKRRQFAYACKIFKMFPEVDEEALKEKCPEVDIEEVKKDPRSKCHGCNNY